MKIVSWNINGIRSIINKGLLNNLTDFDADVICLQELKAHHHQIPLEVHTLPGYVINTNTAYQKGYSGVAVLTRFKRPVSSRHLGLEPFDSEGRFLEMQIEDITVVNIYLPHGGRQKQDMEYKLACYNLFLKRASKLVAQPAVLIGDFNVAHTELDLARWRQNKKNTMFTPEERSYLDALFKIGWTDTYRLYNPTRRQYTWWPWLADARGRNIGWRIDYAFVSPVLKSQVQKAFILDQIQGSDHCPIGLSIK